MKRTALSSLVLLAAASHASVTSYGLTWLISYPQESTSQPSIANISSLYSTITTDTDTDVQAASLQGPLGPVFDYIYSPPTLLINTTGNMGNQIGFFLSQWPAGTYTATATAGTLAGSTGTISFADHDFSNEIPYLTGTSFSDLQLCPAGTPLAVTWDPFTHTYATPTTDTSFTLVDYTEPGHNLYVSDTASSTGTTIPGNYLVSGHHYLFQLMYSVSDSNPGSGFGGTAATGYSFARRAEGFFHVDPEPGTISGQIYLANFNRPIGEILTFEALDSAGNVLDSGTAALGYDNWFAWDTTALSAASIRIKGRHWLSVVTAGPDLNSGVFDLQLVLPNGDVDGNNLVDIGDYTLLALAFDAVPGDVNWNEPADLDGNSVVDIADYTILAASFDLVGE